MNLYQKLIEVRKTVPYLQKSTKSFNYCYVSGTDVLGSLKEKMDSLGLLLIPSVTKSTMTTMEVTEKGQTKVKPTVHADMIMIWINADNPEERLEVPFACFGMQDDISKAFGSALTYSERYFLLKFFNIATDKDDPDTILKKTAPTENDHSPSPKSVTIDDMLKDDDEPCIATGQVANLKMLCKEFPEIEKAVKAKYKLESFKNVKKSQWFEVKKQVEELVKAAKGAA